MAQCPIKEEIIMEVEERVKAIIMHELATPRVQIDQNTVDLYLLKQIVSETAKNIDRLERNMDAFREEMRQEMKDFKSENLAFQKEMKEFKDEMKEFKDEMKEFKDEVNKRWGDLSRRLGTMAEDIFGPGIPYLLKKFGYEPETVLFDLTTGPAGRKRQYDVLIFARSVSNKKVLFVAEVKNQARPEDFEQLRSALTQLPELFEPARSRLIIPILASFRFVEGMEKYATRCGVLLVRMGGDYLEPLNSEVVGQISSFS